MKAIKSLIAEHQIIDRVSAALDGYAERLQQGKPVEEADLARFAQVFTDFAECIHHEKEENILLPMLSLLCYKNSHLQIGKCRLFVSSNDFAFKIQVNTKHVLIANIYET